MMTTFTTSDLVLASVLRLKGYKLAGIELLTGTNRSTFSFTDVDPEVLQDFSLGRTLVEPTAFNATLKSNVTASRRLSNLS
jgi:hypothetical protein